MSNSRTLNTVTFQNAVALNETNTIGNDPTIAGGLPANIAAGSSAWRFDGSLGPLATKPWHHRVTLSGGVATLDLTALADDILTTVDMSGLSMMLLHVTGLSTNTDPVSIAPGASNPYTGWCKSGGGISVGPSDQNALGPMYSNIDVDGTHKTLDLASADLTAEVDIVALFG